MSRPDEAIIDNERDAIDVLVAGGMDEVTAYEIVKGRIPPEEAARILQRQLDHMEGAP